MFVLGVVAFPGFSDLSVRESETVHLTPYITSVFFFITAAALIAAATGFLKSKWWGWGLSVTLNLCLLAVAYYLVQSEKYLVGFGVVSCSAIALWCCFSREVIAAKRLKFTAPMAETPKARGT